MPTSDTDKLLPPVRAFRPGAGCQNVTVLSQTRPELALLVLVPPRGLVSSFVAVQVVGEEQRTAVRDWAERPELRKF